MAMKSAASVAQPTIWEKPRSRDLVTLKEVAAQAGVSPSVASTVLSGGSNNIRVAPETQARVLEAAQQLGYRSRRTSVVRSGDEAHKTTSAGSAAAKTTATVTVGIITSFNPANTQYDPWEHDITAGLEIALGNGSERVVTHYCNRGRPGQLPLKLEEAAAQLLALGVDALALIEISSSPQVVGRSVPILMATNRPFVIVSSSAVAAPIANVSFDSVNAGYQAARHLLEQGYQEIHFLSPMRAPWADERIEGAREALQHMGLSPDDLRVFPGDAERAPLPAFDDRVVRWDHNKCGYEAGNRLFETEGAIPQAVIAANDATAVGFLEAAEEREIRAGTDFALMGFDDAPEARQHSLTTVRPPRDAMGREAARLLLRLIAGDETARQQIRLTSHLMARRSTPPCAALSTPQTDMPSQPLPADGHISSKGAL